MADDGFVIAVGPDGQKRRVPKHYLTNPGLGEWKLPPSERAKVTTIAENPDTTTVQEPAAPATNRKEASK